MNYTKTTIADQKQTAKHLSTGQIGEAVAAEYLIKRQHKILDRNYRKPWGEIDIVTILAGRLFFIEVKTTAHASMSEFEQYRADGSFAPEQHVNREKKHRLRRVIETWLLERNLDVPRQLDVLAVHFVEPEQFAAVQIFPNIDLFD